MSTNDVPGANADNGDELAMGCWAEHEDGSLIFVESTEGDRVVFSIFDAARQPPLEWRDAMPEDGFKQAFSWQGAAFRGRSGRVPKMKWTWHDKTPFPWDRIIKAGTPAGARIASRQALAEEADAVEESASRVASAAARVAEALGLKARRLDARNHRSRTQDAAGKLADRLRRALAILEEEDEA